MTTTPGSRLAGTSSSTRTLDQRDLAALRPMPAPKPRAQRKAKSGPMLAVHGKLFCVRCNVEVKDDLDGVRHVNSCLWKALVEVAGSADGARDLSRGMRSVPMDKLPGMMSDFVSWRASLSDEECREADALATRLQGAGYEVPDEVKQKSREYNRRIAAGTAVLLTREEAALKRRDALVRAHRRKLEIRARRAVGIPTGPDLRSMREASGISRDELAKVIGVSPRAIAFWENGKNLPRRGVLDIYLRTLRELEYQLPPVDRRAALRKGKGLTQKQVGDLLGVSDACVGNWECGRYDPQTYAMMKRYSEVLGWKP